MAEQNDASLIAARPGEWLAHVGTPRGAVLAAEIARIDRLVSDQAATHMTLADEPASFARALRALA
jgi:hypothetical protein